MKLRMFIASLLVLTFAVSAAFAAAEKPAAKPAAKPAEKSAAKPAAKAKFTPPKEVYECTHCKVGMDKPGKCPACGMDLTKMKGYMCEKCMGESDKPGNCAHCKVAMKPSKDVLAAHAEQCSACKAIHEAGKPCPA